MNGGYIYSIHGDYKPTYNWGVPSCMLYDVWYIIYPIGSMYGIYANMTGYIDGIHVPINGMHGSYGYD